jgi:predicted transcriptional regulator of viral defense system
VKKGLIERISHGVYKSTSVEPSADFQWQDLILTARSITNGVICLISALSIYQLTDEIPRAHWIAVPNSTTAPMRVNTIVKRMRDCETGKIKYQLGNETILIFDRERTLVDSFRFLGQETALKALNTGLTCQDPVDINKIQNYAKKLHVNIMPYLQTILSLR